MRLRHCVIAFLMTGFTIPGLAKEAFTPRDFFDIEVADNPKISPDGSRVSFVRRSAGVMSDRYRSSL